MQVQITTSNVDQLAKRVAATATDLGFTKNGKPMVASQGLRVLSALAGFREEHSLVAALKAETSAPQDQGAKETLGELFNYLTSAYAEEQWDGTTRELLNAAARVLGQTIEWHTTPDDSTEEELLVSLATNGSHLLDLEDIKFWVGLHYHRIYENETPAKRCEWIRRYAEMKGLTPEDAADPITEAQKQELRNKGYRVEYSDFKQPFWTNDVEESVDFASEDAAWADAWSWPQDQAQAAVTPEKQECGACGLPTQVDDDGLCNACALRSEDPMAVAIASLEARWGDEHDWYGREEWQQDVAAGNTKLGYWEWVQHSIEGNGGEAEHCSECGSSLEGNSWDGKCGNCADKHCNR